MKKYALIFALFTFVSIVTSAQPQLTWRFANAEVVNAGTQFQFDVEVKADAPGTFHRDLQVYFDYNTLGFGTDIVANGNFSVAPLALMNTHYFVVNTADNTSSKFAIITEGTNEMTQPGSAAHFNAVPTTFTGLLRFTIDIVSNAQPAGIVFDAALMDGGQYYQSTTNTDPMKYAVASAYDNDLLSFKLSSIYGNIVYGFSTQPIHSATLTLKQGATTIATVVTDANGDYSFSNVADGNFTIETACSLPKGGITSQDLALLRNYLTFVSTLTPLQLLAADVNWDGGGAPAVTSLDLAMLRDFLTFVIPGFPAPDWVFYNQSVVVTAGIGTSDYAGLVSGDINADYTGF